MINFRIVTVDLLVPEHSEDYMDALSELRDDAGIIAEWAPTDAPAFEGSSQTVAREWARRHREHVTPQGTAHALQR